MSHLSGNEMAQVINYLRIIGVERALLINFGQPSLQYKRLLVSSNQLDATL